MWAAVKMDRSFKVLKEAKMVEIERILDCFIFGFAFGTVFNLIYAHEVPWLCITIYWALVTIRAFMVTIRKK